MLVYEKIVDGVKHLYGAPSDIPSESDEQLTYLTDDGQEISNIADFKLVYGTANLMKGTENTIPSSEDEAINVFCGDEVIIGQSAAMFNLFAIPATAIIGFASEQTYDVATLSAMIWSSQTSAGYRYDGESYDVLNPESEVPDWLIHIWPYFLELTSSNTDIIDVTVQDGLPISVTVKAEGETNLTIKTGFWKDQDVYSSQTKPEGDPNYTATLTIAVTVQSVE